MPTKDALLWREKRKTQREFGAIIDAAVAEGRPSTDDEDSRLDVLRARLDEVDDRLRAEQWQGFLRHSEVPCRAFRLQAGDVLIFESERELSDRARANIEASVRALGDRLGFALEGIVLEEGLRLVCSREAESPPAEEARPARSSRRARRP